MTTESILKKSPKLAKEHLENISDADSFLQYDVPTPIKVSTQTGAKGIATLFEHFPRAIQTLQFRKSNKKGKDHHACETFTKPNTALAASIKYNNEGYDVYFMVNEGNGKIPPGGTFPRCMASVISLTDCFLDTDNCPFYKVEEYLAKIQLTPHLIIQSSPNKFHVYFHLQPTPPTPQNIAMWKAIQNMTHRLGNASMQSPSTTLGMDSTMHDYSKLLRVPGFLHMGKLTPVTVTEENDIPRYTLEELFEITHAEEFLEHNPQIGRGESKPVPELTGPILSKGERFEHLQRFSMHLANDVSLSDQDKVATFRQFIINRIDNSDNTYLIDDTLTHKSQSLIESAIKRYTKEKEIEAQNLTKQLEESEKPKKSSFSLPDEFYLSAPNGMGDLVKQVMTASAYPCASLAFGTMLTGISMMRAQTHFTPDGESMAIYTLNIAPSGHGKNDPMVILKKTLARLNMGKLIQKLLRSDQGVLNHLDSNDSAGIFIVDEIAGLLRMIQDKKKSAIHQTNIEDVLLSLYSAGSSENEYCGKIGATGRTKASKDKEIVLHYPRLAIAGYTVPESFFSMFNSSSVATGLFPRFISIVTDHKRIRFNRDRDINVVLESELFPTSLETSCPEELSSDEETNLGTLQSAVVKNRKKQVWQKEAKEYFLQIVDKYRDIQDTFNESSDSDTVRLAPIAARVAEHVLRISSALSKDIIEIHTIKFAESFMENNYKATMQVLKKNILISNAGDEIQHRERIILELIKLLKRGGEQAVSIRELQRKVQHYLKGREFRDAFNDLCEMGRIKKVEMPSKTRPVVGVQLLDVMDDED